MKQVGVRELRQHASRYLERVRAGETIEVTMRGMVIARLVPPAGDAWGELVQAGNVRPPSGSLLDVAPVATDVAVSSDLRALRAGER